MTANSPMYNDNKLKLGIFSANCSGGMAAVPFTNLTLRSIKRGGTTAYEVVIKEDNSNSEE